MVVAIEDMHVADPATCHAAESLLSVTDEAPLLLAFTMRPEPDSAGWAFHVNALASHPHRVVDLSLEPLEEAEAEELAEALGVSEPASGGSDRFPGGRQSAVSRGALLRVAIADEEMRSRTWTITTRASIFRPRSTRS